jgi:hypothetical protein
VCLFGCDHRNPEKGPYVPVGNLKESELINCIGSDLSSGMYCRGK